MQAEAAVQVARLITPECYLYRSPNRGFYRYISHNSTAVRVLARGLFVLRSFIHGVSFPGLGRELSWCLALGRMNSNRKGLLKPHKQQQGVPAAPRGE